MVPGCFSVAGVASSSVARRRDVDACPLGADRGDQTELLGKVAPYPYVHGDGHNVVQEMA